MYLVMASTLNFSPVLVRFDLMEDWSPNWHLSIAVGEGYQLGLSLDHASSRPPKMLTLSLRIP